jgi:Zn-dependent peptidase ImmA (M78 family)
MRYLMPKVFWFPNKKMEEMGGHLRKYERSWIKGSYDKDHNVICLNERIITLNHPIFFEFECLFHEISHAIFSHRIFGRIIDRVGIVIDAFLYNHTVLKSYRRRKKCK